LNKCFGCGFRQCLVGGGYFRNKEEIKEKAALEEVLGVLIWVVHRRVSLVSLQLDRGLALGGEVFNGKEVLLEKGVGGEGQDYDRCVAWIGIVGTMCLRGNASWRITMVGVGLDH
jgi:hypothetical protein